MLPDVEASFLGVVERWKSVLKLWRATTPPATPVSNPKRIEPMLAAAETEIAPLCFLKVESNAILLVLTF